MARVTDGGVWPEVSICIPTYNRCNSLAKAIESALSQDYPSIRIIVLDNCSEDDTSSVVEGFQSESLNIDYFVNGVNIGPAKNFEKVMSLSTAHYAMWLADDDWLDVNYVSACMDVLLEDESLALVSGSCFFVECSKRVLGQRLTLKSGIGCFRLLRYYFFVNDNSFFYGVYRNRMVTMVKLRDESGTDCHFMAAIAFQGKIRTIDTAYLYRSLSGASANMSVAAQKWGEPWWVQAEPYLGMSVGAFREIMTDKKTYGGMTWLVRLLCASLILFWLVFKKVILRRLYKFVAFFCRR